MEAATSAAALDPDCADLVQRGQRILTQVGQASERRMHMQRVATKQEALGTAEATEGAGLDNVLIASLGRELESLRLESAQLPLSEEDYLTLSGRHALLVQAMAEKCRELAMDAKYAALRDLGALLESLRAVSVEAYYPTATTSAATDVVATATTAAGSGKHRVVCAAVNFPLTYVVVQRKISRFRRATATSSES
jgi:hypothetical protein